VRPFLQALILDLWQGRIVLLCSAVAKYQAIIMLM
jgi:hypothetical protein